MNSRNESDILPEWIKQLKSQTWQIEMLIAGSAVYTLFSLSGDLQSLFYKVYPGISFNLERTLFLFGVYIVSRILLIGFILNLILRSVWLAYLGINFAFPNGVDFDRLKNHSDSIENLKSQPTILKRVNTLETLCKLSYSISILLAIFMTSVFITTIIIHLFLESIGFNSIVYESWFSYSIAILIVIIQFGILDRIFLSRKSKHKILNLIKQIFSTFLYYFTLSFLFRREFLAIKSNISKWNFSVTIVSILGCASILTAYQIGKFWPYGTIDINILDDRKYFDIKFDPFVNIYDYDENITDKTSVLRASIPSPIIEGRYLRLFVTSWSDFDNTLETGFKKYDFPLNYKAKNREDFYNTTVNADSIFNMVLNDLFHIEINHTMLENLSWKSSNHPKSRTKGYITYIDINDIPPGEYRLSLIVNFINSKNEIVPRRWKDIQFWKE